VVLVDTSVWVAHLRDGHEELSALLDSGQAMCHPFVVGELACGNLINRKEIISLLRSLPQAFVATSNEVLTFIEGRHLAGKGLGYVDVHLLAASILTGVALWTSDKQLHSAALDLNLAYGTGPVA
jgi:predicted nucleic acid-binding protein